MSLSKFTSEIKKRGVAKSSLYSVFFTYPQYIATTDKEVQMIQLFCESVQFPEFVLQTSPIKDDGNTREIVYDKIYPPVTCTFICDTEMFVKKFFDKWTQGVVKNIGGVFRYSSSYIIPELVINQLNSNKEIIYKVTLNDVYPKLVSDVILSASSREINRVQVQFVYRSWKSEIVIPEKKKEKKKEDPSFFDDVLNKLRNIF